VTHNLKAPGFNPCAYYEVKILVSKFAFKWVNLYRYNEADHLAIRVVGLCTLESS
jgi:hypothetical protein